MGLRLPEAHREPPVDTVRQSSRLTSSEREVAAMAGGYEVVTEALVAHTSSLGRIQDQLATALDAAGQVSMPRDAYGVICQFFPPMVDPIEQSGVDALAAGVESVTDTITAVEQTARDYDAAETANATSFSGATR